MKKSTIILSLVLCFAMLTSALPVSAAANDDRLSDTAATPTSKIIVSYLINAGYPMDIIESLDGATMLSLYEGGYQYDSSETTYGVFTEDYKIEFTLDSNDNVVIDAVNLQMFEQLLEDDEVVEKILDDKANSLDSEAASATSRADIADEQPSDSIKALSNWTASMVCSHKSYSGGVAKKKLTYTWKWDYSPAFTLTDKVAMAWSGGFTAEPNTIYWSYNRRVGFTGSQLYMDYPTSGYGYNDYNPGAGVGKDIDIKTHAAGTFTKYHNGTLSVDITKTTSTNSRESAVGRYYHKHVTSGLSLSFSASGPSISVSSGSNYDQSSDSAVAFWATSN